MRAVWSFWSAPFRAHRRRVWASERHHLLSWVLSTQSARRHYHPTVLHTDDDGARMLVDGLGLEFDEVHLSLNALQGCDPQWWSAGKLYAYHAQQEPFVHIDNDVFLWQPLAPELAAAAVFTQNPEPFTPGRSFYQPEVLEAALHGADQAWLPIEWTWYRRSGRASRGDCCGIFGGQRLDFIQHYAGQAIRLLEHPANATALRQLADKTVHMVLIEQYLLAASVEYHRAHAESGYHDIEMRYLFDSPQAAFEPGNAARLGYTHLIADAKRNPTIAGRLEARVQRDYPAYLERCNAYARHGQGGLS